MPTTPNRGWIYPTEGQNPYFDTIENLFLAQDTDVQALVTSKYFINVKDYGAVGDGTADDTSAIQAAINLGSTAAGYGVGNQIFFPAGRYRITAALTIDRVVTLAGCGTASEIQQSTLSASILNITAVSSTGVTAPVPNTSREITVKDLALSYAGTATGGACIWQDPGATNMPFGCRFLNLDLYGGRDGLHFERGAYWTIDNCNISGMQRYGVYIDNLTSPSSGDAQISNTLFWDPSPTHEQMIASVYFVSSGGLRLINCKNIWGQYGVLAVPNQTTSTLNISNCSFGGTVGAIKLDGTSGAFLSTVITGCGFGTESLAPTNYVELIGSFQDVTLNSNDFLFSQDDAIGIKLSSGVNFVTISGNNFTAFTGTNLKAIDIGTGVQNVTIAANGYHGTFTNRLVNLSPSTTIHNFDNLYQAKGDLVAGAALDTPTRLPVGTDNHVLIADSTAATGLAWALPRLRYVGAVITPSTVTSTTATALPSAGLGFVAGALNVVGTHVRLHAAGRISTGATPGNLTVTWRLNGGDFMAFSVPLPASQSAALWNALGEMTVRTAGTSATLVPAWGLFEEGGGAAYLYPYLADDFTANLTLSATLQMLVAFDTAGNSLTLRQFTAEILTPTVTV